ncbi:MAG: winged helix-turn-helix transcriptional regulator [Actinomycetales bacterium]|nr:winged helix-turn-helix transcriptional regulator [Actinomycetales bacterium]
MLEVSRPSTLPAGPDSPPAGELLEVVADPVRWRILATLAAQGCQCVCVLQEAVPIAPNLLSYHLRVLREAGLVVGTRRGRWVDYVLAPDVHARLVAALPTAASSAGTVPVRAACRA